MKRRSFFKLGTSALATTSLGINSSMANSAPQEGIIEDKRSIPIAGETDVIVCGGGPAGFAAAVTAARMGASVRLIEVQGYLGGVWTAGLMTHIIDSENKKGVMKEILDAQKQANVLIPRYFDVEHTKLFLERKCEEIGVKLLYHTRVVAAIKKKEKLDAIITENCTGRQAWKAKVFIDTTGNGDLGKLAGCGFKIGHPESGLMQPVSLNMMLTGITLKDLREGRFISSPGLSYAEPRANLLNEIRRGGADCSYSRPTFMAIREDLFSLMANHEYRVNATDTQQVTDATINARLELHQQIDALRSLGGIWKNIRIVATADQIGMREGRRILGRYTITKEDLINGSRFDDAVCRVTFKVDVHSLDPSKHKSVEKMDFKTIPYDIPLRALIAKEVDGLLMAGRCISGDFYAHASYRVTGNAVHMGEGAGLAAAMAIEHKCMPQDEPVLKSIKERLESIRV